MKETAKKIVAPIIDIPGNPVTNESPGRGNAPAHNKVAAVNAIATMRGVLRSFLKNVTAIKNIDIGMLKYCMPPHEAFAKPRKSPPATAFKTAIPGRCFRAEMKR